MIIQAQGSQDALEAPLDSSNHFRGEIGRGHGPCNTLEHKKMVIQHLVCKTRVKHISVCERLSERGVSAVPPEEKGDQRRGECKVWILAGHCWRGKTYSFKYDRSKNGSGRGKIARSREGSLCLPIRRTHFSGAKDNQELCSIFRG